jgi:nicotinamidase-related amidase
VTDTTCTLTLPASTALVVVDAQQGFDDSAYWGPRNNPDADDNIAALVGAFTATRRPIVFWRQGWSRRGNRRGDRRAIAGTAAKRPSPRCAAGR